MPSIRDAIVRGPLSQPERAVLDAIDFSSTDIYSTSLEDLAELALRCIPNSEGRKASLNGDLPSLTLNTSLPVLSYKEKRGATTYSLRTIKKALASLAKTNRIWRGKLYFSSGDVEDPNSRKRQETGRIYYGKIGVEYFIQNELDRLNPEERAIGWYKTMPTTFSGEDDTPEP